MASRKEVTHPAFLEPPGMHFSSKLDGSRLHVGIVYTSQSSDIVHALVDACRGELLLKGVKRDHVHELQVSLPFELPYATKRLIRAAAVHEKLDAVVCIGCLVKGKIMSFEFIAEAVTRAILKIGAMTHTPVINGVLVCLDDIQARACAGLTEGKTRHHGYGVKWAQTAIQIGQFNQDMHIEMMASCVCGCHGDGSGEEKQEQHSLASDIGERIVNILPSTAVPASMIPTHRKHEYHCESCECKETSNK